MDQIKIGKFIAECRKNVNLTQMQLAEKTEHNRQSAFQMGKRKIKNCLGVIYNPKPP